MYVLKTTTSKNYSNFTKNNTDLYPQEYTTALKKGKLEETLIQLTDGGDYCNKEKQILQK